MGNMSDWLTCHRLCKMLLAEAVVLLNSQEDLNLLQKSDLISAARSSPAFIAALQPAEPVPLLLEKSRLEGEGHGRP